MKNIYDSASQSNWTHVRINSDHVQSTFSLSTLTIRFHRTSMLFALNVTSVAHTFTIAPTETKVTIQRMRRRT
jgi:hypothetical protein